MPVESKPLFRPDVLRPRLQAFRLPERVEGEREKLDRWGKMLASGRADGYKEQELLPDFLADVFCGVLGYSRAVDNPSLHTFSREKHVQVDGKFADAVLGAFRPEGERYVVVIEGKGPKDPLDRPFAGRRMSAVDQAYRYAINLPCDWLIVTSIKETRLHHKGADQYTYERFDTRELARDEPLLKKFVYLLGADRVVPTSGECHLYDLLKVSEAVGKELTREFYLSYAEMREKAFHLLAGANPSVDRHAVLAATQKLLDRVLFCSFCEDRGLLPADTILRAYQHADPYNPRPIWENFRGLFKAVNLGNEALRIPAYNGGLFADDAELDRLNVPDEVCRFFRVLADYDYRPAFEAADEAETGNGQASKLIDVDILGHIFEQSITDLERIRNELDALAEGRGQAERASRRKKEGAFYTPAFITRHIVGQTLGQALGDRFEGLRQQRAEEAAGTARRALDDPRVYDLNALNNPQRDALVRFWELWQDELAAVRVLDPSCGSGAFLIEAFDQLHQAYQQSNDRLQELRGHQTLFDLDRRILQNNLYGVDLNEEAVQICRLSLWIKTARRGKILTSLDHSIRVGNSVIDDPEVHPRAFDWKTAFPEVFAREGFDVVVGNPPYVRQEWISPFKPFLQGRYQSYHGAADLYVYFYELGMRVLRPGGRLSFIVTNKWLKAAYGEPLRRFFAEETWVESVVDFGHAKQIFPDADVFPSIIVARKPTEEPAPAETRVCVIPREQLRVDDLNVQISQEGFGIKRSRFDHEAWSLEPKGVHELLAKIREKGAPLTEYTGVKLYYGIKTGYNEAFIVDTPTRDALVAEDPNSADIIKPYFRGRDIKRWSSEWAGLWMIVLPSSSGHAWPWSNAEDQAEDVFAGSYPSIYAHMKPLESGLRKRKSKGRFWWELMSCTYWSEFGKPKLIYQEIQFHPSYSFDTTGYYSNNKTFFVPTDDLYLLSAMNSPLLWWHNWRYLPHMKDEALSPATFLMESLPIASPTDEQRGGIEANCRRIIELTTLLKSTTRDLLDWLKVEHEIEKPSTKLLSPLDLDSDAFAAEVRKVRGKKKPLSVAAVRSLREEHARTIVPAQSLAEEARGLERQISDLVNEAYGLTPEEVRLMWETAPPRMPIDGP